MYILFFAISGSSDQKNTALSKDHTGSLEVSRSGSEKTNNNRKSPPLAAVHSGGSASASIVVTSKNASIVLPIKVTMMAFILWHGIMSSQAPILLLWTS